MTGILGLVGEGSPDELHAMAARMAYRGGHLATWSPAPGILLGELFHAAPTGFAGGPLALDASGNVHAHDPEASPPADVEARRARVARDLAARGVDALRALRGHFALAFWNERDASLWLACDRQRYKWLYTVALPGRLAFASDYKALLALADCPARVDRDALQTYLRTLECPGDRSLLADVRPLGGADLLRVRPAGDPASGRRKREHEESDRIPLRWWSPECPETRRSFREEARALRPTLGRVLRRSLAGHRRVGLTLSGGLDSTALLALARHVRPDLEIATYTIGHGEDDREILGAREAARHFHTEHHEHFFDQGELPALLPGFVWLTEDPKGREEPLLQQVITRVAALRDRVVVWGNGADGNFCGMPVTGCSGCAIARPGRCAARSTSSSPIRSSSSSRAPDSEGCSWSGSTAATAPRRRWCAAPPGPHSSSTTTASRPTDATRSPSSPSANTSPWTPSSGSRWSRRSRPRRSSSSRSAVASGT